MISCGIVSPLTEVEKNRVGSAFGYAPDSSASDAD